MPSPFEMTPDDVQVANRMIEAIQKSVQNTDWASPDGSIVVDALIVMVHVNSDGIQTVTWINRGSPEVAEGLARRVVRDIEMSQLAGVLTMVLGEEDDGLGD